MIIILFSAKLYEYKTEYVSERFNKMCIFLNINSLPLPFKATYVLIAINSFSAMEYNVCRTCKLQQCTKGTHRDESELQKFQKSRMWHACFMAQSDLSLIHI